MADITSELDALQQTIEQTAPGAIKQQIADSKSELARKFAPANAIQVGDQLPPFRLKDAVGVEQSSADLLAKQALVITFYRGEWCPFCNIALAGLQKYHAELKSKDANLVAITPELPNNTLTMTEKHELKFPVLTDLHNEYARQLGIVWKQPSSLRPVYEALGHDLQERNGDDSFEVPIPATLLVDRDGVVRNLFIEPDYYKRVDPKLVMGWVEAL
ncbi:redoxin domain-containing protein [Aspergillus sclerotiicarbonarius CBS 121057]|uniref:thioredoxin-dependent peroxiredoxin n=1 Tax=Aspergillus sclerotiicarbonarius (strain CBS 121057 / IBT 28362) TaxID=1448318 RepID=A0A319ES99_ASPSB|nr:redoxin domain-containing protein [Aspergillus sclerotiicarbonarius CBS 121057]